TKLQSQATPYRFLTTWPDNGLEKDGAGRRPWERELDACRSYGGRSARSAEGSRQKPVRSLLARTPLHAADPAPNGTPSTTGPRLTRMMRCRNPARTSLWDLPQSGGVFVCETNPPISLRRSNGGDWTEGFTRNRLT